VKEFAEELWFKLGDDGMVDEGSCWSSLWMLCLPTVLYSSVDDVYVCFAVLQEALFE
jgi:hypothetical protein